jgi:hypothetical protein
MKRGPITKYDVKDFKIPNFSAHRRELMCTVHNASHSSAVSSRMWGNELKYNSYEKYQIKSESSFSKCYIALSCIRGAWSKDAGRRPISSSSFSWSTFLI